VTVSRDPINQTRYLTLIVVLGLAFVLCLGGAVISWTRGDPHPLGGGIFLAIAFANLAMIPIALIARQRNNRRTLERIALAAIGVGLVGIMQRLGWYIFVYWAEQPEANPFRQMFQFLPFFYVAVVVLLQSRRALQACWVVWGTVSALAVFGLLHAKVSPQTEGMMPLLLWLLLANPLFILLLHALPRYESALAENEKEIAALRERTELLDRLKQSERRFNLVVEALEVGVWDRRVGPPEERWWSPRFYELIGYSPEELPANEDSLKSLLHPEDRDTVWEQGTQQLRETGMMDVDFRMMTKHRGYRWFNTHAKTERDAAGRTVRMAGSITDIHDTRMSGEALRMAQAELTRLAYRDTLTDLYNRRYFDEHFQREWERARRSRQPLSLMLIDLDHFKAYNDRYGHAAGDSCLVQVSQMLSRCSSRPADIVARLGGEEFGIVLPETSAAGAEELARRMQALLDGQTILHEGAPSGRVTFSVGIASIEDPEGPGPSELFEQADRALYEVKRRGRNGILRFGVEAPAWTNKKSA
jgi:diguanylate cyclase (GGDEF)-like protein/PAS domain S-box-containing protein